MIERIKRLCKEQGTNITKLCIEVTGNSGNLSTWNKGHMRSDYLLKCAQILGVTTDYLLTGKEPQNQSETDLTDDEIELLSTYRQLPQKGKTMARAYIYNYLEREEQLPPVQIVAYSGSQYENAPQPDLKKQKKALEKYDKN